MNALSLKFRQTGLGRWFHQKEQSEQRVVLLVAVLVVVALGYVSVWKPVSDWQALEANRRVNTQNLYDWLRANEATAKATVASGTTRRQGQRSPIQVITRAASSHGLNVASLKPEQNGTISVTMQQQPFNKIVAWLAQLEENNGVAVQRLSIDSEDVPGYVNAQIRLQ